MLCERLIRKKHVRGDGWLAELVSKKYDGGVDVVHSYVVGVEPGRSRAGHFHKEKKEWLGVACGRLELVLEDVASKEKERFVMDCGDKDYYVYMIPPNVAHVVRNIGRGPAALVVFSDRLEDPGDTFKYDFKDG